MLSCGPLHTVGGCMWRSGTSTAPPPLKEAPTPGRGFGGCQEAQ